jgi:hypothetical protein
MHSTCKTKKHSCNQNHFPESVKGVSVNTLTIIWSCFLSHIHCFIRASFECVTVAISWIYWWCHIPELCNNWVIIFLFHYMTMLYITIRKILVSWHNRCQILLPSFNHFSSSRALQRGNHICKIWTDLCHALISYVLLHVTD